MDIVSRIYINGIFQGETTDTSWPLHKIYTKDYDPEDINPQYYYGLKPGQGYSWRVDSYTELYGETTGLGWTFDVGIPSIPSLSGITIVESRSSVSSSSGTTWNDSQWSNNVDYLVAGGGRYQDKLIAVSQEGSIFISSD